jgi:acyl-activating enzyme 14
MPRAHLCLPLGSLARSSREAVACGTSSYTGEQLHARVAALSNGLSYQLQLRQGEVAAVLAGNSDALFAALLALVDAGAVAAPLNTRWSAQEAAAATQLCGASLLVAEPCYTALAAALCAGCAGLRAVVWLGEPPPPQDAPCGKPAFSSARLVEAQLQHRHVPQQLQLLQPSDGTALVCFTSGTTGTPKGAALSHAALHFQSLAKLGTVGYSRRDVYLHMAPLFHVGVPPAARPECTACAACAACGAWAV